VAQTGSAVNGFGKISTATYGNNIRRKSGNIADSLRRWGRIMINDYFRCRQFMTGESFGSPGERSWICILKRASFRPLRQPSIVTHSSVASNNLPAGAYGPMAVAGLRFWQLGERLLLGHNAILRVHPLLSIAV